MSKKISQQELEAKIEEARKEQEEKDKKQLEDLRNEIADDFKEIKDKIAELEAKQESNKKLYQVVMSFAQNLVQYESVITSKYEEESSFILRMEYPVQRVMEVIVELLKEVDVEKEPATKKQQVQGYFEKENHVY
ncbi:hypothetical protein C1645_823677 [Glomus cerebriforme]|uniref:Nucleotide exchange factor GrpE n=1 Tax=Glomus cerebriforme TaxID=658196 RepID=A0A397SVF0_9GLOM|nr:hypothetical protein C1645_823677 [Glomus cerebriforme]